MKLFKIIINSLVVVAAVGIAAAVGVPQILSSYQDWKDYYEENYPEIDPATYSDLISINAELKEGVVYYDNLKANPVREDFVVTGTYKYKEDHEEHPGEEFDYVLEPEHYNYKLTAPDDFNESGGDLVISYSGKVAPTISYTLVPVVLEKINVLSNPYNIVYEEGDTFDKTGLVIEGEFNDGSIIEIAKDDFTVDQTTPLTLDTKSVQISYTFEGETLTLDLSIKVVSELNNGNIVDIEKDYQTGHVYNGQPLSTADFIALGVYESGNRRILESSEYTITNKDDLASFGRSVFVNVQYNLNTKITGDIQVYVTTHAEAEDATIVGGKVVEEDEYVVTDGVMTSVGLTSSAGDFAPSVLSGKEGSITWDVISSTDSVSNISLRCANSNLIQNTDKTYSMKSLRVNTIADLYVNDEYVRIESDVVLEGCGPHKDFAPLYNVFSIFTFKNVQLKAGVNKVKIQFKPSTINEINHWKESPSTMNIDWVEFETLGSEVELDANITSIYFDENAKINYGDPFIKLYIPVFGIVDEDPDKVVYIDRTLLEYVTPSGEVANVGNVTIEAYLKANPEIRCSKTFTVDNFRVEAENGTLSGNDKIKASTTETFALENGVVVSAGNATYVGGFDNSTTKYSGVSKITLNFLAANTTNSLIVRCSNSYVLDSSSGEYGAAIKLDDVVDIYLNGVLLSLGDTSIPGVVSDDANKVWTTFHVLTLTNVTLKSGENTLEVIGVKNNSCKNKWNEYAVPRFDYFEFGPAI